MWKEKILELTKEFKHPAWGVSHFKRIFELSLELAKSQLNNIDSEALFAAAYLHDIGAFDPYSKEGIDHSEVSIENCDEILSSTDFPSAKIPLVKDIIKTHMFYVKPGDNIESQIFHDADTLDFMGAIGITRILSIAGKEDWTPDLISAIKLIKRFCNELPNSLVTDEAKKIGIIRKSEMEEFLKSLAKETKGYDLV
ncbi:MAG: HD domain-containing protein [Promethearchaeota archaeon]